MDLRTSSAVPDNGRNFAGIHLLKAAPTSFEANEIKFLNQFEISGRLP